MCVSTVNMCMYTRMHIHFTALFPGPSRWPGARRKLFLEFYGTMEDNRGRHTDHLAGHHSIRINQRPTSIVPPFLGQMPFLLQPCQFILAWDRHQICWQAYPVAWLCISMCSQKITFETSASAGLQDTNPTILLYAMPPHPIPNAHQATVPNSESPSDLAGIRRAARNSECQSRLPNPEVMSPSWLPASQSPP